MDSNLRKQNAARHAGLCVESLVFVKRKRSKSERDDGRHLAGEKRHANR